MAVESLYIGSFSVNNGLLTPANALGSTPATWTTNANASSWNATGEMNNPVGNQANGTHVFTARVRKETGTNNPTFQMQVQSATGAVLGDSGVVTLTSATGQDVVVNVSAATLAAASGGLAGIRVYLVGTTSGGSTNSARSTPQLDYVSWVGDFTSTSAPPVANAGTDQNVTTGATVNLNGTGSTDDVGITSWLWEQVVSGSATILEDASSPAPVRGAVSPLVTAAFSPPANSLLIATVTGDYDTTAAMSATVTDSGGHQWTKVAEIAQTTASIVSIWECQLTTAPGSITVSAAITNLWNSGNTGQLAVEVLTGAKTDQTSAVIGTTQTATVTVMPTAIGSVFYGGSASGSEGGTQTPYTGTTFLDSYFDSTNVFYNISWKSTAATTSIANRTFGLATNPTQPRTAVVEVIPGPAQATVTLVNPTTSTPSFTAPSTPGDYTFRLTVTDGEGQQSTDTVVIHVAEPSTGPTVAIWNGSSEVPATIKVWNGSTEVSATLELVP